MENLRKSGKVSQFDRVDNVLVELLQVDATPVLQHRRFDMVVYFLIGEKTQIIFLHILYRFALIGYKITNSFAEQSKIRQKNAILCDVSLQRQ